MQTLKLIGSKLWDGWMWFAHKVALVNEFILLGAIFFVFIGVYALIYDLMLLFQPKPTSMWRSFEHQSETLEALEKQF